LAPPAKLTSMVGDMASEIRPSSRYREIYQAIRDEIARGSYGPGEKLPTGAQLCERFGVARATVGRAIEALEQDGLIHRRRGSGTYVLRVDRPGTVKPTLAFFAPFVRRNEELPHVESHIVRHLAELAGHDQVRLGFHCLQPIHGSTGAQFAAATDRLLASEPHGVLYYPAELLPEEMHLNGDAVGRLQRAGCKVVLIDRELDTSPHRSELTRIGYDNVRGGILLVDHLVSVGCRRIVFVGRDTTATSIEDRMAGYWTGLCRNGIRPEPTLVFEPHDVTREVCEAIMKAKPDAIICYADRVCARIGQHFAAMGVRIGEDVKMAGFDDDPIAALLPVPLTTIRLPARPFAKAAYDAVLRRINSEDERVRQIIVDCELVVRESTRNE